MVQASDRAVPDGILAGHYPNCGAVGAAGSYASRHGAHALGDGDSPRGSSIRAGNRHKGQHRRSHLHHTICYQSDQNCGSGYQIALKNKKEKRR